MRRDQAILVEGVLRDFPRINLDRVERHKWLEVMAVSGAPSDVRVDGGRSTSVQDRYLSAMSDKLQTKLERIVKVIYDAFIKLSESEKRVVSLCCFRDMSLSEVSAELDVSYRFTQRIKANGFEKMRKACVDVISDVEDWRDYDHAELSKNLCVFSEFRKSGLEHTRNSYQ